MSNLETLKNKGAIVTLVLVFGLIFLILLGSLMSFILYQLRTSVKKVAWNEALHLAEAGIDYYKWCLNNEVEGECDLGRDYYDAQGNLIGSFSLDVDATVSCGQTVRREIVSTGTTERFPSTQRKVKVTYARTSVAEFAYLLNDNVWAGPDREIKGFYHSNGGIRMDGENQSLVSSHRDEWVCTSSFGCNPCPVSDGCRIEGTSCICPGVFTTTGNARADLFDYPAPYFNFDGITIDLDKMKTAAQNFGVYLPPSKNINPQGKGYHVVFQNDGTFDVSIITNLSRVWGYDEETGWHWDYFIISSEYLYQTYSVDSSCSAVFLEDNLWVEGEVDGKITLASADLIDPNKDTSVVLPGDIGYYPDGEEDGLALIAENNVLISPVSPDSMELKGIFIAQKGHFGRNHYQNNIRDYLEIIGSVVSNGRVGTQWTSGSFIVSGYERRENYVDNNLIYNPPPFVPYTTIEFEIVKWEEIGG